MVLVKLIRSNSLNYVNKNVVHYISPNISRRFIYNTVKLKTKDKNSPKSLIPKSIFDNIDVKNKQSFQDMLTIFEGRDIHRRGHVEFIYAALKNMKDFGVHKDLDTYKKLIDILPKGKFVAKNIIQAEFMHYPKQQQCIIDLLEQMENNGVVPDFEMEQTLLNTFGKRGYPLRKFWRMMYWMPKFKNLSPWPLPNPLPDDSLELAKIAIRRIMSVDLKTEISVLHTSDVEDSLDKTWIVTGQSPVQKTLLEEHDVSQPVYIEGAFTIWLRGIRVNYFILRAEPKPKVDVKPVDEDDVSNLEIPLFSPSSKGQLSTKVRSVHEQDEGTILAVCATGNSSRDSLLSWIRLLEKNGNPKLANVPIVFTLKSPTVEEVPQIESGEIPASDMSDNKSEKSP